jgi:hypothetical protein
MCQASISRSGVATAAGTAVPPVAQLRPVRGATPPAIERHHRPQIGWDHRQLRQDHPLGLVVGLDESLDQREALGEPRLELGILLGDLLA